MKAIKSACIWSAIALCILVWLPLLAVVRAFDRDTVRYRTGWWFRRLGVAVTRVNPLWRLRLTGVDQTQGRVALVLVSNHQSLADIPLISHLPWEMKWVAKKELFRAPLIGWMMRMAGDIPVDRSNARSGAHAMRQAARYLEQRCPVMFFPEGTRSRDGRVGAFNDGAFHLALRAGVPVLPIAVDGSHDGLPKNSWKFGSRRRISVKVLQPIAVEGLGRADAAKLRDEARHAIIRQLALWRGVAETEVDALALH